MGSGGETYIFPKYGVSLLVLREQGKELELSQMVYSEKPKW